MILSSKLICLWGHLETDLANFLPFITLIHKHSVFCISKNKCHLRNGFILFLHIESKFGYECSISHCLKTDVILNTRDFFILGNNQFICLYFEMLIEWT